MAYYARYEPDETGALQKVVYNCGVGFCLPFYGTEAPPGTLACDGSEISREAYKELFAVLGTKAGAGDGVSTFNLPDFRGNFIRCIGGNAAALGVEQGDAIRNITGSFFYRYTSSPNAAWLLFASANGESNAFYPQQNGLGVSIKSTSINADVEGNGGILFSASRCVPTSAENRPVNVALLWCIIYE